MNWVPVLAALITGVLAFLVGRVTAATEARREQIRWVRDQRLATYLALQEEVIAVSYSLVALAKNADAEIGDDLTASLKEIGRRAESIALLGPTALRRRFDPLMAIVSELRQADVYPTGPEAQAVLTRLSTALGNWNDSARSALEIPD